MNYNRKLITEGGREYYGFAFGDTCNKVCELVFNTSMVGYQEIISDPSYTFQAVVMTYTLIGNYGMAQDDYETDVPTIGALIVREYNDCPSNFRSVAALSDVMKKYGIPGIYGVDTREIARSIRDSGSCKALITDADVSLEEGMRILSGTQVPSNAVSLVSTKKIQVYSPENVKYRVAAIDCGMKKNIVRSLVSLGCEVTVLPGNTSAEVIEKLNPDGVFISNGPGDPADVPETVKVIRQLRGKYPVFGICLGHQIIALAYGARTYKLKFGHRGGNHPVKELKSGKIEITSQNHSYAVDPDSLKSTLLEITHINLLDGTVEGLECKEEKVFSVQYHPESAPGPQDSFYLFSRFIKLMEENRADA